MHMLVGRTIKTRSLLIPVRVYKSKVCPHLEYCTPAWDLHYKKEKELLEKVKHRCTRMFEQLRNLHYMDRLQRLGLWTLQEKRNRADLIDVFRIVKRVSNNSLNETLAMDTTSTTRVYLFRREKQHVNNSFNR
jgi:hypothetical protein